MASMTKLKAPCKWHFCKKRAKYEVRDNKGKSYGSFCARHARNKVKFLRENGG